MLYYFEQWIIIVIIQTSWIKLLNHCLLAQIYPLDSTLWCWADTLHIRFFLSLLSTCPSDWKARWGRGLFSVLLVFNTCQHCPEISTFSSLAAFSSSIRARKCAEPFSPGTLWSEAVICSQRPGPKPFGACFHVLGSWISHVFLHIYPPSRVHYLLQPYSVCYLRTLIFWSSYTHLTRSLY